MLKIIGNKWEDHELMLMITTICSLLTFKKIKKLEHYKNKLKNTYTPF